jgi:hypothetical protein
MAVHAMRGDYIRSNAYASRREMMSVHVGILLSGRRLHAAYDKKEQRGFCVTGSDNLLCGSHDKSTQLLKFAPLSCNSPIPHHTSTCGTRQRHVSPMAPHICVLQTRRWRRAATILLAFSFSVTLLLFFDRPTPRTYRPADGEPGGPLVLSPSWLQPCGSDTHSRPVETLKVAESKYKDLLEDKFTYVKTYVPYNTLANPMTELQCQHSIGRKNSPILYRPS